MPPVNEFLKPPTTVVLNDGQTYTLGLADLNVTPQLETKFGINLMEQAPPEAFDEDGKLIPSDDPALMSGLGKLMWNLKRGTSSFRFVLWTLLQANHPGITEQKVGSLLTLAIIDRVSSAILTTLINSLPPLPDETKNELALLTEALNSGTGN